MRKLLASFLICMSSVAAAQSVPIPMTLPLSVAQIRDTYRLYDMVTENDNRSGTGRAKKASQFASNSPVVFVPSQSRSIEKLAAEYPANARTQVSATFKQLLEGYGSIEQQFSIPKRDVAGAVAAFLAGTYMAYHDVSFPDEHFQPLVNQMRQIIGSNPDFAKATNAEKQEIYEQMAILGMFMATTQMALKEHPNAQVAINMKQAAKGYLEQFLKTDADRVQITAHGLVVR